MPKMRLVVPGLLMAVVLVGCVGPKARQTRPDKTVVATVTLEVPGMT